MANATPSSDKPKPPIWSTLEIRVLQTLGLLLIIAAIFFLLSDKATTGATALAGGILLVILSKPEIISSIEGLGFKLSLAKAEVENTLKIAEQQISEMRRSTIEFTRQQFEEQSKKPRPITREEKIERRHLFDSFLERFRKLGATEEEILTYAGTWRESLIKSWEQELAQKNGWPAHRASENVSAAVHRLALSSNTAAYGGSPDGLLELIPTLAHDIELSKANPTWDHLLRIFDQIRLDFSKFKGYPPVDDLFSMIEDESLVGLKPIPPLEMPENWPTA